jgi:hypothetical protein
MLTQEKWSAVVPALSLAWMSTPLKLWKIKIESTPSYL